MNNCQDWGIVLTDGYFGADVRTTSCYQIISNSLPASTNVWTHVAASCNGSSATLYVNGNPVASGVANYSAAPTTSGTYIGRAYCCGGEYFAGMVDEVGIFSRPLTTLEITNIVAARQAGMCWPIGIRPIFTQPVLKPDKSIQLNFPGKVGYRYEILASTNLVNWAS